MEIEIEKLSEKLKKDLKNEIINMFNMPDSKISLVKIQFEIDNSSLNLNEIEKNALIKALAKSSGNITKTSQLLGVTRKTVYSLIKKYNLVTLLHTSVD